MVFVSKTGSLTILVGVSLLIATQGECLARNADELTGFTRPGGHYDLYAGKKRIEFNINDPADLRRLERELQPAFDAHSVDSEQGHDKAAKRAERGLREIHHLAHFVLECSDTDEQLHLKALLLETVAAVNNLRQPPLPETIDFFQTPWFFLQRMSRPVGKGRTTASNLQGSDEADLSRLDPKPSSFWSRPAYIGSEDLFHGFGRTNFLMEPGTLCTYAGPKESFGRNPGFDVECDGRKLKLKFAEVSSEPFAARIFEALGYHTDPTDYTPVVRVRYSRRMLQEFNSRKPLKTHFTFLGLIPLFTLQLQPYYDPFDFITTAVLTNGTRWSGASLKRNLFRDPGGLRPELQTSNFRPEIESAIDFVETVPANVQLKVGKSIGPWDFESLDHCGRRELRGAGLLAAWLGWFDTRFDNTRLRILSRNDGTQVVGFFSDVGGVLGETTGVLYQRGELPNDFPWTFTRPPLAQGPHRLARPLRLQGYKPIAPTPAFAAMNIDDARWMARLIGTLREEQIKQALVAAGFDSAHVRLYLEKLVNRRDEMLRDLGLSNEIQPLRPSGINRYFCYNPVSEGVIAIAVAGKDMQATAGHARIVNGKLISR